MINGAKKNKTKKISRSLCSCSLCLVVLKQTATVLLQNGRDTGEAHVTHSFVQINTFLKRKMSVAVRPKRISCVRPALQMIILKTLYYTDSVSDVSLTDTDRHRCSVAGQELATPRW